MLCWSCKKVKGKRSCPAHHGDSICPRCCGSKRRTEIRCPDDCPYLHGEHDRLWESPARRTEQAQFIAHFGEVQREQVPLLVFLHHLLLQARQNFAHDLSDRETLEVVSTLARTFETLSKGIIYEHQTESPRLQAMINWLGNVLDRRAEISQAPRSSDNEVLAMLQILSGAVQSHREQSASARSYLDVAERVFRAGLSHAPSIEIREDKPPSGLIVEP